MSKVFIPVSCCNAGDILAEDVNNNKGVTLVAKNTVVNQYIKEKLWEMSIFNIWIYQTEESAQNRGMDEKYEAAQKTYKKAVLMVKEFLNKLSDGGTIDYHDIKTISEVVSGSFSESGSIIKCLADIRCADEYTYTHCINVAFYAMLIAKWLKLPDHMIQDAIQAGFLHDIGKVKVPDEILNKKGKLLPEEFEIIKKHSTYGIDLIKDIPELSADVKKAVLSHHERSDGSGYPQGLFGDSIDIIAKIVAVADVYDAMTQNRVYKEKTSPFESFKMFLTVGMSSYDTSVVSVFLKHLSALYVGSRVLLSNGEKGEIVYVPPHDIIRPTVRIENSYCDLSKSNDISIVSLLK